MTERGIGFKFGRWHLLFITSFFFFIAKLISNKNLYNECLYL